MKKFRNESLVKNFPILKELGLENSDIDVQRIDKNILKLSYQDSRHDGSMGSDESNYKIWFVLEDGTVIENPVKIGDLYRSNYAHSESWDEAGETLAEAVLGYENNLKYIVVNCEGYSNWNEKYSWNKTTIYKLPKNETLDSILDEFRKEEEIKVQREISF